MVNFFSKIWNAIKEADKYQIFKIEHIDTHIVRNVDLEYIFDRRIFYIAAVFAALIAIASLCVTGISTKNAYYLCKSNGPPCVNPLTFTEQEKRDLLIDERVYGPYFEQLRKDCSGELCSQRYLQPGDSLGIPPSKIPMRSSLMMISLFLFAFIGNHFIYNRGRFTRQKS